MKTTTLHLSSLLGGILLAGTALLTQPWVGSGIATATPHQLTGATTTLPTTPAQLVRSSAPPVVATPPAMALTNNTAPATRIDKVRQLVALGNQGVASLSARLATAHTAQDKTTLCYALVRIGSDAAMQTLINAVLAEKNEATRIDMMQALDVVSSPTVLELTTSLLGITSDPIVLEAVNRTVARMGNADTVQFLSELYAENETVSGQHQNALTALAAVRNPTAVPAQAAMLNQTTSSELGLACARSLAKTGTPEAIVGLVDAFEQLPPERFAQRQAIVQELSAVGNPQSALYLDYLSKQSTQLLIKEAALLALENLPMTAVAR